MRVKWQTRRWIRGILLGWLLLPVAGWAQTAVLVHGFQSQGMDWRLHGVTPVLQQQGWVEGGNLTLTPRGPVNAVTLTGRPEKVFYTIDLPSRAPVLLQADLLELYLQTVYAIRQEPLTLVGHSAGGVVARSWLLRRDHVPADALITIAAPHTGTPLARWSALASLTPMSDLAGQMGFSKWTDPEDFYRDLRPEEPGNFLYWLNHQPHPVIRYVSLVRKNDVPSPDRFDFIVPPASQDMNNVWVLRGHSEVLLTKGSHFLGIADGYALGAVLRNPATVPGG